jgi:sugar phosphate isomerase/epimerase
MRILYFRATWGMELPSLEANLRMIKDGGFDGVEMGAPLDTGERKALRQLLDKLDLELIVQMWTAGANPAEHAHSLEEQYRRAVEMRPRLVNSHTGKDHFGTAGNVGLINRAMELENELGVPIAHEVHRGRATFSTLAAMDLLDVLPDLRLIADFSHWCCVHESLLQDQDERLERAIRHAVHIHARVGHGEGPQVNDPRAPEWREAVETHLGWWQRILDHQRAQGAQVMTITPEFGPPDYMPTLPYTRQAVANLWDVNVYMRELCKERLS